jgi:PadR family transcriptional regulator PadR
MSSISKNGQIPIKSVDFHILLVLSRGKTHPYGLIGEVLEDSDGAVNLDAGSLYRIISRLESEKLIFQDGETTVEGRTRKLFSITDDGETRLNAEIARLRSVVKLVETRPRR